ncbi:hypothetical protein V6N13_016745 [Hibiscus sabdariffa]
MITPSFVMKNSFKNFQTHLLHILSVLASITSHRWFVVITVDAIKTVVIARSRLYAPFTEASTQSLWRKPRRFIEGSCWLSWVWLYRVIVVVVFTILVDSDAAGKLSLMLISSVSYR